MRQRMAAPLPPIEPLNWSGEAGELPDVISNRSRADFEAAVETGREHIAAGDVFQLVLSQRLEADVPHSRTVF